MTARYVLRLREWDNKDKHSLRKETLSALRFGNPPGPAVRGHDSDDEGSIDSMSNASLGSHSQLPFRLEIDHEAVFGTSWMDEILNDPLFFSGRVTDLSESRSRTPDTREVLPV